MSLSYPLAEKHSKRKLRLEGRKISLYMVSSLGFRTDSDDITWEFDDIAEAAWNGATLTLLVRRNVPLAEKDKTIILFILTTDYRIDCMNMVGPLREAETFKKWTVDEVLKKVEDGASVTIRPPTTKELHWAQTELEKMIEGSRR